MASVKVYLFQRKGRKFFECQWTDPITGQKKSKSTKTTKRREAERFAGILESELTHGRLEETTNATWETLANRYEVEVLDSLAVKTKGKFQATRRALERIVNPKHANTIDASIVSRFQSGLRTEGKAEATIKGHLASLRACLNWAEGVGLLKKCPRFTMPKRTGKMKGRPITAEEFDRMVDAIPKCNVGKFAPAWEFLLRGLWTSGLRLDEALRLSWTDGGITVNLSAGVPRLKIEANMDKSGKARLLPVAPEFAEFLIAVPSDQRRGRVFRPIVPNQMVEMRLDMCSKVISRFGEKAGILVAEYPPRPGETTPRKKFASAHDLRRAFGTRWARANLKPQQLKDLMRHESIQTTMTYYVEESVADVESAMRKNSSDTLSDTTAISTPEEI